MVSTFWVGFRSAFAEMRTHKVRSGLSLLGVMLGVAALVAMLSLIGGIDVFLREKMGDWIGGVWIWKNWEQPETLQERLARSRSPGLRFSDGSWLAQNSKYVKRVSEQIERWGSATVAGENVRFVRLKGVTPETFNDDSIHFELALGRLLTPEDYRTGNRVAVVSWRIVERVSRSLRRAGRDTSEILGSQLQYNNARFTIVGTLRPRDPDNQPRHVGGLAAIPLLSMKKYVTGYDPDPGNITLVVNDPHNLEFQTKGVASDLQSIHRGSEDFEYRGAEWLENMSATLNNISLVMGIVSVVSLVVGGMGIMNVMLSSISERIREIGIRKALGAQNGQIFVQFLAETVTLSVVGGIIGAAIGLSPVYAFSEAIRKSSEGSIVPTILPLHAILVALIIAGVGIVFGLYPAVKASRMDPVDALRYE